MFQVTIHPTVTYYKCPKCPETATESLVFVSPDRVHDYHSVNHFTVLSIQHLRGTTAIRSSNVVQWTNGCAAQYKSKGPFSDIVHAPEDLKATLDRNFFGSRHGKGPCDGESAVVKNFVSTAIAAGNAIITNTHDLFQLLVASKLTKQPPDHGCSHSLRTFFWVGENDVNLNREARKISTVPGT